MSWLLASLGRWPFHEQVLAALLLTGLLAVPLAGEVVRRQEVAYLKPDLDRQSHAVLSMLAGASLDAVISEDRGLLETIVEQAGQRDSGIIAIRVENESHTHLATWQHPGMRLQIDNVLTVSQPVQLEGETFGFIHVEWDIGRHLERIDQHIRGLELSVTLALLATIGIVLGMLHLLAMRPLGRVRLALGNLDDSRTVADLDGVRTSRELGQVVDAVQALATAQAEIKEARDRAEAGSRVKSQFMAMMSHELRTPLNGIMGMSQVLGMTELNEEQLSYLENVQSSAQDLLDLVSSVLYYISLESQIRVSQSPLDLREIILKSIRQISAGAAQKSLELNLRLPDDMPVVMGHQQEISRLMLILLKNAVTYCPCGRIGVEVLMCSCEGSRLMLEIRVSDTGIGIPADQLEHIFEPFSQVDQSISRRYGGIGLGLAIARQISLLLGGQLWVESEVGVGSVFHLRLPMMLAQMDDTAAP